MDLLILDSLAPKSILDSSATTKKVDVGLFGKKRVDSGLFGQKWGGLWTLCTKKLDSDSFLKSQGGLGLS